MAPTDLTRCVFHAVTADNERADVLLPRSELSATQLGNAALNYTDTPTRQALVQTWIPLLERRWDENVFFSPVRPHAIWQTWHKISGKPLPPAPFWAVPVQDLPRPAILDRHLTTTGEPIDDTEVHWVDPNSYRAGTTLPPASERWLRQLHEQGLRGAWWNKVPHILSPGPVPLTHAAIIDWSEPPDS